MGQLELRVRIPSIKNSENELNVVDLETLSY